MKSRCTSYNIIVLLFLILCWPTSVRAGIVNDVGSYFSPATGSLVAIQGDDYLISLDASAGVMVGDLLSIVTPGEELIDPASGAILGNIDRVKGVLKVTRVRSGFSQARPLGTISMAQAGDSVRRYQNLTSEFQDQKGTGLELYKQLVSALPALEWQGYYPVKKTEKTPADNASGSTQLTFVLTDTSLNVHDSAGQILRSFPVQPPAVSSAGSSGPLTVTSSPPPTVIQSRPQQEDHQQVNYSAAYPGFRTLGEFSEIVLMADLLSTDGQLLIASSNGSNLEVSVVTDHMQLVASEKIVQQGTIHAVAWWQPETKGDLYLAVTASATKDFSFSASMETVITSSIYRFSDAQLSSVAQNLPYLLGTFDRSGDGVKETLLGQRFDLDTVYGPVRELKLNGSGVSENAPEFEMPLRFPVQGSLFADLTGDGKMETIYTRSGVLYIINNGKLRYESSKQMGGSLSRLTYDLNPGQADALFTSIAFEVPQVAADIDGDGQLELIAVSADRSAFGGPGLNYGGSESWLSVIKYQNGRFVKGVLGEKLEKPIQGLAVDQRQVLIVLSQKDSILDGEGQSYLLALPLAP